MEEEKVRREETLDPEAIAEQARLTYVDEHTAGYGRRRCGRGFFYLTPSGNRVTDRRLISRFKSLAIPPAWEEVWIAGKAGGHIQATGRDARGRKQYIYHARWQEVRNLTKYERLPGFGRVLPHIRKQVDRDLSRRLMSKERAAAFVVRLLELTCIRIGNREYARMNRSYGLTTLQDHHLEVEGSRLVFDFPGKGGKRRVLDIRDRKLARIAKKFQDLPGQELIQYRNGDGALQTVESGDVNGYLQEITGIDYTAKDFRTWGGTVMTAAELQRMGPAETKSARNKRVIAAIKIAAEKLGNTPSICRKYYVHPAVIDAYVSEELFAAWKPQGTESRREPHELSLEERAVLDILENPPSPV